MIVFCQRIVGSRIFLLSESIVFFVSRQGGTMVTYGGMSKKPITVSTSSFIFKVHVEGNISSLIVHMMTFSMVFCRIYH